MWNSCLERSLFTHQLTNVAVKGIAVVGRLVSVIIILLDDYEIVSNSLQLPLFKFATYNIFLHLVEFKRKRKEIFLRKVNYKLL